MASFIAQQCSKWHSCWWDGSRKNYSDHCLVCLLDWDQETQWTILGYCASFVSTTTSVIWFSVALPNNYLPRPLTLLCIQVGACPCATPVSQQYKKLWTHHFYRSCTNFSWWFTSKYLWDPVPDLIESTEQCKSNLSIWSYFLAHCIL